MPPNQNFFLEPKLAVTSKSDKISLKRQRDLIGHVLLYTSHHHTAALAFYFILADNGTWHLFVFEF